MAKAILTINYTSYLLDLDDAVKIMTTLSSTIQVTNAGSALEKEAGHQAEVRLVLLTDEDYKSFQRRTVLET